MGGYGSGNWYRFDKKATVEDCWKLDVNRLARDGVLVPWRSGSLHWENTDTGERLASVSYVTFPQGEFGLGLRLSYRIADTENVELPIRLQTTRPHFGGRRWWFACPLLVNGVVCKRRVAKLYMRGRHFGCRHCHDLSYRSCQEAHHTERMPGRISRMQRLLDNRK